jgi:hypothetical protein
MLKNVDNDKNLQILIDRFVDPRRSKERNE